MSREGRAWCHDVVPEEKGESARDREAEETLKSRDAAEEYGNGVTLASSTDGKLSASLSVSGGSVVASLSLPLSL